MPVGATATGPRSSGDRGFVVRGAAVVDDEEEGVSVVGPSVDVDVVDEDDGCSEGKGKGKECEVVRGTGAA